MGTIVSTKMSMIQLTSAGQAVNRSVHLRPILSANSPTRIGPTTAPAGVSEPIHDVSSLERVIHPSFSSPASNFGWAGDVQPRAEPAITVARFAVHKVMLGIYTYRISMLTTNRGLLLKHLNNNLQNIICLQIVYIGHFYTFQLLTQLFLFSKILP